MVFNGKWVSKICFVQTLDCMTVCLSFPFQAWCWRVCSNKMDVKRMASIRSVSPTFQKHRKKSLGPYPRRNLIFGAWVLLFMYKIRHFGVVEMAILIYILTVFASSSCFTSWIPGFFTTPRAHLGWILGTHDARTPKAPPKNLPLTQAFERLTSSQTATLPLSILYYIRYIYRYEKDDDDDNDEKIFVVVFVVV